MSFLNNEILVLKLIFLLLSADDWIEDTFDDDSDKDALQIVDDHGSDPEESDDENGLAGYNNLQRSNSASSNLVNDAITYLIS